MAEIDAALADLIPKLKPPDLPALLIEMLANNELIMREMERRRLVGTTAAGIGVQAAARL